ncbi:IscS subfamily cysteine desulfurase [Candidatus Woesearchaeota archaeon]|nr:IscS subfamily cysteine desulfurase [Candidatus Woesearchaeota archaeon]
MKEVYLDNGATTMVDPKVLKAMIPYFSESYGNAYSIHNFGLDAKSALEDAREIIAKLINADPEEIVFTSGGTESNNLAIKGIAFENKDKNHIITTKVEHKCVMESCKWLEKQGFKVTYLDVDKDGFVDPKDLEKAITDKTALVSIIHGNNEIGGIMDLEPLGKICKKHGVYFHTDACQSFTKTELDVKKFNLDLVTLNAHKIHGPKGVGALFVKKDTNIKQWQSGGLHEHGLRAGTENIHGIVGFGEAAKLANENHVKHMEKLRDKLIDGVLKIPDTKLNGPKHKRLCNNANFSFKSIEGEALGGYLDQEGIASSTGSACSSGTLEPSYVLTAIGLDHEGANGSQRFTLSRFTTEDEIDHVLKVLPNIVKRLREISPLIR